MPAQQGIGALLQFGYGDGGGSLLGGKVGIFHDDSSFCSSMFFMQLLKALLNFWQENLSNEDTRENSRDYKTSPSSTEEILQPARFINTEMEIIANQLNRDVDAQPHPDNMATTKHHLSERVKLAIMLNRADLPRHKHLKDHCEDSYTMGRGEYPANTIKLLAMMKNFWQQVTTRCVEAEGMQKEWGWTELCPGEGRTWGIWGRARSADACWSRGITSKHGIGPQLMPLLGKGRSTNASCWVTTKDISNAHTIFVPYLPFTRGKSVQSRSMRVEPGYVFILPNLLSDCNIVLAMHVMFVCSTILSWIMLLPVL